MSTRNHLVWSEKYQSDLSVLGSEVAFALDRGKRVLEELKTEFSITPAFRRPRAVSMKRLQLVHSGAYLRSLKGPQAWAKIFGTAPLPESEETSAKLANLLKEVRIKSGGTLLAARLALKHGLAANLGGGYHHAYADHGDGFCLLNDIAVAVRTLQDEKLVKKVLIVDLDFHQGNGTSHIFHRDEDVYTLDLHTKEGWPFQKERSTHDVPIARFDGPLYLEKLQAALDKALKKFKPELVIMVQGADAYEHGMLTRGEGFSLPLATMKARDELVIDTFASGNIPLALVFAGGYGGKAWEAHYQGVRHLLLRAGLLTHRTDN